jgi:hypothetical protein
MALEEGRVIASGDVAETIERYLEAVQEGMETPGAAGFSFDVLPPQPLPDAYVTRVELLDEQGAPATRLETGGYFRARVHFRCLEAGPFSLLLRVLTPDGVRLIAYPMEAVDGCHVRCGPGDHHCDLIIPQFPVAAGTYVLSAGVSRPRGSLLHLVDSVGDVEVAERDICGSGRPVRSSRCLLALPHSWAAPADDAGVEEVRSVGQAGPGEGFSRGDDET